MKKNILFISLVLLFTCFTMGYASDETVVQDDLKTASETDKTSPMILQSATPGFPMKAQADRVEGFVAIKFTVTKVGAVKNPEVVESVPPGYFESAALNALEEYKFKPATEFGVPVDYELEWPFFFKFSDSSFSGDVETKKQACRSAINGKGLIGKGEYQNAVKEASKAIDLEPKFGTAYYYRSLAYMNMEEYEKALSDINRAIELTDNIFGYYTHRGAIYLFSKDYQKAIDDFNKSISIEPRNIVALIDRGDAYRLTGKYEEAVKDYTSALDLNDKLIHVHNNRGYVYYKLKDNDNACKDFKTACELGDCRAYDHLKNKGVCEE